MDVLNVMDLFASVAFLSICTFTKTESMPSFIAESLVDSNLIMSLITGMVSPLGWQESQVITSIAANIKNNNLIRFNSICLFFIIIGSIITLLNCNLYHNDKRRRGIALKIELIVDCSCSCLNLFMVN